jgi:hypothetical protein
MTYGNLQSVQSRGVLLHLQAEYADVPDDLSARVKQWLQPWRRSTLRGPRRLDKGKHSHGLSTVCVQGATSPFGLTASRRHSKVFCENSDYGLLDILGMGLRSAACDNATGSPRAYFP